MSEKVAVGVGVVGGIIILLHLMAAGIDSIANGSSAVGQLVNGQAVFFGGVIILVVAVLGRFR